MAYDEMGHQKRKRRNKKPLIIFSLCAVIAAAVASGSLLYIFHENKPMQDEESMTDDLRDRVIQRDSRSDKQNPTESSSDTTAVNTDDTQALADDGNYVNYNGDSDWVDGMDRRIDFDYLHSINPDICGWLYMPNPYVDLPILQEQEVGSTYYLSHSYTGAWNSNGSLLTPKIPGDMDDAHKLIFGHNMGRWSSVMFSALPRNFCYQSFAQDNPYIYLYYPDRVERWVIWAAADAWSSDDIYEIPYTLGSDNYGDLLNHIDANKNYYINDAPDKDTRITVLSTCTGGGGSQSRFYIAYKPDAVRYYDEPEAVTDTGSSEDDSSETVSASSLSD